MTMQLHVIQGLVRTANFYITPKPSEPEIMAEGVPQAVLTCTKT